ncbi:uncharacterized protein METZ01_LOCUS118186, partial [marine metagenome]
IEMGPVGLERLKVPLPSPTAVKTQSAVIVKL